MHEHNRWLRMRCIGGGTVKAVFEKMKETQPRSPAVSSRKLEKRFFHCKERLLPSGACEGGLFY